MHHVNHDSRWYQLIIGSSLVWSPLPPEPGPAVPVCASRTGSESTKGPGCSSERNRVGWEVGPSVKPSRFPLQNLAGTRVGCYITIFMFWSGLSQAWWNQSSAFGPGLGLRGFWFWKTEDVLNTRVSELWPGPALDQYRTRTSSPILEYGSGSGPCLVLVLLSLRLLAEGCMLLRRLWVPIPARFSPC